MFRNQYTGERDLEGVAFFVIILLFILGLFSGLGYLLVQDSKHQTECVKAGYSYVDGNCLTGDVHKIDD